MYRVLCDGELLHDSNLETYTLIAPKLEIEVNKSGAFTFQITSNHPSYNSIVNKKSYIEIYEDGKWLWSGRPIKIDTAMKLFKTVTCEGELSFLHDSVQPIAEYHDLSVKDYFTTLINNHNADVDEAKRFTVGNVTVTDPNDSLYRFSNYEKTFKAIQEKLVDKLGGYVVLRHEDGIKYIDYVTDYPYVVNQEIKFGKNIIDFAMNESFEDMISAIVPLGAKLSQINADSGANAIDGNKLSENARLTVESANNGLNYIADDRAVERFGLIKDVVIFDDVTMPSNLLSKGYEELAKRIYSNLEISLSVFDRGYIEKNINKFKLGATVTVDSVKHGINNNRIMIRKMMLSLVDVTQTKIETGISKRNITDNFAQSNNSFDTKVETIVSDFVKNEEVTVINPQINELTSKIEQTSAEIRSEVSSKYLVIEEKEAIYQYISSMVAQSESDITFTFTNLLTGVQNSVNVNQQNLERYIRFDSGWIELGEKDSPFLANFTNTELSFSQSGQKIAFFSNSKLYVLKIEVKDGITNGRVETGYYDMIVRSDKHWTLKYRKEGSDN